MASFVSIATNGVQRLRRCRPLPAPFADERGFTLIELLIAMVVAVAVFSALLSMLETSQRVEARDSEWALTLQEARSGLARMARDIRQAWKVEKAEAGTIDFLARIGATAYHIRYECGVVESGSRYKCVRLAAEEGKSLPASGTRVVAGVLNGTEVFKYFAAGFANTTEPDYVTLKLELPASGSLTQAGSSAYKNRVVLTNAAYMRNLNPEL